MQNKSFDIAGPNPTLEEQKKIDEQYTVFLEKERRSRINAAFTAKKDEKVPLPVEAPNKPRAATGDNGSRPKLTNCARHTFSCDWPKLSESIKDLKKLFTSSPSKAAKRS